MTRGSGVGEHTWLGVTWYWLVLSVLFLGALVELRVHVDVPRDASLVRIVVYGLGLHLVGYLTHQVESVLISSDSFRDERRRTLSYLALLHLAVALSFLSAIDLEVPTIYLAVSLVASRCVLFFGYDKVHQLSGRQRRQLWEMAGTWILWSGAMVIYLLFFFEDGFGGLVWENADARHYYWLSNQLVTFQFEPEFFPLGLSLFLAPMNLMAGTFAASDLQSLSRLNGLSVVFLAFVVSPAAFVLLGRTCREVFFPERWEGSWWSATVFLVLIASVFAYALWFQPAFISPSDAKYHPIMMFGLTPSVEPMSFLFAALALHFLRDLGRFSAVAAGAFLGTAVMVKETNALIGLLLVLFLWVAGERAARLVTMAGGALAVYAMQLVHNAAQHGSLLGANRTFQWEQFAHRWADYVHTHHGISFLGSDPPRISPAYASANAELLQVYWLPLALVVVAWFLLVRTNVRMATVATFAFAATASLVAFHLGYLRSGAIFRYLHTALPLALFLLVGLASALPRYRSLFRRTPTDVVS